MIASINEAGDKFTASNNVTGHVIYHGNNSLPTPQSLHHHVKTIL
jgi:hypothetical protein